MGRRAFDCTLNPVWKKTQSEPGVRIVREARQIEKVLHVILEGLIPPAAAEGAEQLQACPCL